MGEQTPVVTIGTKLLTEIGTILTKVLALIPDVLTKLVANPVILFFLAFGLVGVIIRWARKVVHF